MNHALAPCLCGLDRSNGGSRCASLGFCSSPLFCSPRPTPRSRSRAGPDPAGDRALDQPSHLHRVSLAHAPADLLALRVAAPDRRQRALQLLGGGHPQPAHRSLYELAQRRGAEGDQRGDGALRRAGEPDRVPDREPQQPRGGGQRQLHRVEGELELRQVAEHLARQPAHGSGRLRLPPSAHGAHRLHRPAQADPGPQDDHGRQFPGRVFAGHVSARERVHAAHDSGAGRRGHRLGAHRQRPLRPRRRRISLQHRRQPLRAQRRGHPQSEPQRLGAAHQPLGADQDLGRMGAQAALSSSTAIRRRGRCRASSPYRPTATWATKTAAAASARSSTTR